MLVLERSISIRLVRSGQVSCRYLSNSPVKQAKVARTSLPTTPARTRFAPSPTGYLHLGSLRTALFNYLLARKTGGQFLLRIEDTDEKRTVADAEERLCADLRWAGLHWDEGPGLEGPYSPYRQSERTKTYQEHATRLLNSGHAYRCFCSAERLDSLARRRKGLGLPTDYDRQCASISKEQSLDRASNGVPHVIRLLAPEFYPEYVDLVYGKVGRNKHLGLTHKFGEIAFEDPVLLKSDGQPTYHLANVVDDHQMKITHVVRATEWMSSTPKHLALYEAFGWTPPSFAHVGLLVNEEGQKLSKRDFATDITQFRNMGVLPESLVNFVALLGWSHGEGSDVMKLDDSGKSGLGNCLHRLTQLFQMRFTKGNTIVTLDKLWHLQKAHASLAATADSNHKPNTSFRVMSEAILALHRNDIEVESLPIPKQPTQGLHDGDLIRHLVCDLLSADARNYTTPAAFYKRNIYFFREPRWNIYNTQSDCGASLEVLLETSDLVIHISASTISNNLQGFSESAKHEGHNEQLPNAIADCMKKIVAEIAAREQMKRNKSSLMSAVAYQKAFNKDFCRFLRWVLVNGSDGPTLHHTLAILGPERSLKRLNACKRILVGQLQSEAVSGQMRKEHSNTILDINA